MHKLVLLMTIASLFWIPCLAQSESLSVDGQSQSAVTHPSIDPSVEADRLFSHGEDPERDRQVLVTLERALVTDANNYQWLWRVARLCYHVGNGAGVDEKQPYFERGIEVGQRAIAQQPTGVEGHFWLGANYGGLSAIQNKLKALLMVPKVRAEMDMALRLQASYENGGAYRALGEMDRQLPGVFGGSLRRAITYLEQGVRVAPQNIAMKLALAKAYRDAHQHNESQQQLVEILQIPVRPDRVRADSAIQEQARQLLGQ